MGRILLFLFKIRAFLLFLLLEAIAIGLISSYNSQQGSAFFNSSNRLIGGVLGARNNVVEYFSLSSVNRGLVEKNTELLAELEKYRHPPDSIYIPLDSALASNFSFKGAKVINNSIRLTQNHITLNKGANHGIKEGMGVFNEEGVVGRVKGVTGNYATVISLLHTNLLISSKIKSTDVFGSTKWDGLDTKRAKLMYIPRHAVVEVGDEVVTSGYNAVFPEGVPIGKIIEVQSGTDTNYLDVTIELATDFSRISYVYLVENNLQSELDTLYRSIQIKDE